MERIKGVVREEGRRALIARIATTLIASMLSSCTASAVGLDLQTLEGSKPVAHFRGNADYTASAECIRRRIPIDYWARVETHETANGATVTADGPKNTVSAIQMFYWQVRITPLAMELRTNTAALTGKIFADQAVYDAIDACRNRPK